MILFFAKKSAVVTEFLCKLETEAVPYSFILWKFFLFSKWCWEEWVWWIQNKVYRYL